MMGTPRWLAPELIPRRGVKRHHTNATDIYAFALVCYEASYTPYALEVLSNVVKFHIDVFRQNPIRGC
jgi:serine/threonine protein kinase